MSTTHLETGRYRWLILGTMFLVQVGASMAVFSFGPLAPFLRDGLHITRAQVGIFSSLVFMAALFFGVPGGWLVDRFGVRRLVLLGPGMFGLLFALMSVSPNAESAYVVVFLAGMGYVFVLPTTAKSLVVWFSPKMRATAVGISQSAVTVGSAVGAVVVTSLALALGWRSAIAIIGMTAVAFAALAFAVYRQPSGERAGTIPSGFAETSQVVANRQLVFLGLLGGVYVATQLAFSTYLVLYLTEVRLLPVAIAATFLMVANIGGAVGRVFWGVISDRAFGGRRKPAMILIGFVGAAMVLTMSVAGQGMPEGLLFLPIAIFGLTGIGYNGVYATFITEYVGSRQAATALGWTLTLSFIGGLAGPPLFGYVVDRASSYDLAWLIMGILMATAATSMLVIRERKWVPANQTKLESLSTK